MLWDADQYQIVTNKLNSLQDEDYDTHCADLETLRHMLDVDPTSTVELQ